MTDRERAVSVLRALRDEFAHDPAICCIVGNAIDVLHNLPASAIWELEDAADRAAAADFELTADGAAPPSQAQAAPPIKLSSRTALRPVPRR